MSTSSVPPSSGSSVRNDGNTHRKDSEPSGNPKPFKRPEQKKKDPEPGQDGQAQLEAKVAEGSKTEESQAIGKTTTMQPLTPISKVHAVILNAVASMSADAKGTTIQMNLKVGSNLPSAFQGGTLTISTQDGMTTIKFDNVKVDVATNLLQGNPEATKALANQLAAKGIQNAQMQVGENVIPLPKADAAPLSPIDVQASAQQDYYQRDGDGNGKDGRDQQEQEGQEPE